VPSWWALAVVAVSRVAAVRARSSRRFIGSWGVPSGYGRFGGGVWGVVEVLTDLVGPVECRSRAGDNWGFVGGAQHSLGGFSPGVMSVVWTSREA